MLESDPDKVRYTLLDQVNEAIGDHGSLRVKVIKQGFNDIIENLLSKSSKVLAHLFNNVTLSCWVDYLKRQQTKTQVSIYKTV